MLILGMESSCDETAAAIVRDGYEILSSVIASQNDLHSRFGGIVPELASRRHISNVLPVIQLALEEAKISLDDIDGIAVTYGPGLIGSLLVGLAAAKAISYASGIPFVGVHHLEGHLASALITDKGPNYPLIALVASGGHTSLYRMPAFGQYETLGQTRDDAAGEAFDKVAKLMGLGYPGGPAIDKLSVQGNQRAIKLPRPKTNRFDFSFSGLKTAVAQWIQKNEPLGEETKADLAASFQEAVVDVLVTKLFDAAQEYDVSDIAVCGGVALNKRLRTRVEEEVKKRDVRLWLAPTKLCTDNAAMIAAAGFARLQKGESDDLRLNAIATIPLESRPRK